MHCAMTTPNQDMLDGGWGWCVLMGSFLGQFLFAGQIFVIGIYLVEFQESFSVGASAVSVIATEVVCAANIAGNNNGYSSVNG